MGPATDGDELLGLQEVADQLGVHYMTVYRYVRTGRLAAVKHGGQWKVPASVVAAGLTAAPQEDRGKRGRPRLRTHQDRLLARLLAHDEAGAWAVIEAAMGAGLEPVDVHLGLLAPALRTIGERWATGEISVGDEHRASAVASRLIGRLGPSFARPGRRRGTVLLGGVAGDPHGLPSALVADVLRSAQYEVVELGPDTPVHDFVATARSLDQVLAVCVSFAVGGQDEAVSATVAALREALPVPVFVGGPGCEGEDHARRLGATATAPDAAALVHLLEELRG